MLLEEEEEEALLESTGDELGESELVVEVPLPRTAATKPSKNTTSTKKKSTDNSCSGSAVELPESAPSRSSTAQRPASIDKNASSQSKERPSSTTIVEEVVDATPEGF